MKRPPILTAVVATHSLGGLVLAGFSIFLLGLARSPETLNAPDAVDTAYGLKLGALALAVPALLWISGSIAMWRRRVWGWWLTFLTGAGMASILVYSLIEDGWKALDHEDATVTAVLLVFPLLMLLPPVRRYFRKPENPKEIHMQGIAQPTS